MTQTKSVTNIEDELNSLNPDENYTFYAQNATRCDADESLLEAMGAWGKDN